MQATLNTGGRHVLSAPVMVDRAWAQALGVPEVKGARRVGNFYQLPRSQYLRLMNGVTESDLSAGMRWTERDDRAVAELLEKARNEEPCLDCA